MDIFAHGLWAAAAAKGVNRTQGKRLNLWVAGLWGIFPDLFAFTIPVVWLVAGLFLGNLTLGEFGTNHPPLTEPLDPRSEWVFQLSGALYNVSHSVFVFGLVLCVLWVSFRRPVWEMGGWFLHILIDVPTHTYQFFPTPVFWPFFDWKFDGLSWGTPWFMILNYLLLVVTLWLLFKKRR